MMKPPMEHGLSSLPYFSFILRTQFSFSYLSLSNLCWSKNVSDPRHTVPLGFVFARYLRVTPVRNLAAFVKRAKNLVHKGQTLYIMLESETMAPEHDEDSKEANKQIVQFLHYPDIWEVLNLSKYEKLDSEGPHSNDALNIRIHGHPHPEHDKHELHFTITGPERCGSETSGCRVKFLRELPGSSYTVTSQRPGEVAMILAEEPNWLTRSLI
ncbi:hypothetical protein LENED_000839 [Lentinula edodes]|uniref:Uncharacterized protein n=1 Tax=Lentinula edodes TaxID=5353 RepID=A0A1Q3DWK0_LENED|nr:hypothetical protein LENED_000839 [Lentinula edodes]